MNNTTASMTRSDIFRAAHAYARDFFANARYPRHELRFKTYAQAFAGGLEVEYASLRYARAEAARVAAGRPRIIEAGTREYAELATDGRLR